MTMRRRTRAYIAGPLFSEQDRRRLEDIERALKALGLVTYLPHRHGGDLGSAERRYGSKKTRRFLFDRDIRELQKADLVVALLDGPDVDSGTAFEVGYACRRGVPVFGLKSDYYRRGEVLNNMVWGACSRGETLAFSVPRLVAMLRKHIREGPPVRICRPRLRGASPSRNSNRDSRTSL